MILTVSRSEVNTYVRKYSQHWHDNHRMPHKERLRWVTTRKTASSTFQNHEIDFGLIATTATIYMYMKPGPVVVAVTRSGPTVEAQGRGLAHYHRFFADNTRGEACIEPPQLYIEA